MSPNLGRLFKLEDTPDPQQEVSCTSFSAVSSIMNLRKISQILPYPVAHGIILADYLA
jgi:hypothetical protein